MFSMIIKAWTVVSMCSTTCNLSRFHNLSSSNLWFEWHPVNHQQSPAAMAMWCESTANQTRLTLLFVLFLFVHFSLSQQPVSQLHRQKSEGAESPPAASGWLMLLREINSWCLPSALTGPPLPVNNSPYKRSSKGRASEGQSMAGGRRL